MKKSASIIVSLIFSVLLGSCKSNESPPYIKIGYESSVVDAAVPCIYISIREGDDSKIPMEPRVGDTLILVKTDAFEKLEKYLHEIARREQWTEVTQSPALGELSAAGFHGITLNRNYSRMVYQVTKDKMIDTLIRLARRIGSVEGRFENLELLMLRVDGMIDVNTRSRTWSDLTTERTRKIGP